MPVRPGLCGSGNQSQESMHDGHATGYILNPWTSSRYVVQPTYLVQSLDFVAEGIKGRLLLVRCNSPFF